MPQQPRNPTHVVLDKDSSRISQTDARRANFAAAKIMTDIVRASFGPAGMYKMIIDDEGIIYLTKGGSTMFSKMNAEHPSLRTMSEAATVMNKEVGDGSLSTVFLAGKILSACEEILAQGIHPTIVADACGLAGKRSIDTIRRISIKVTPDRQTLSNLIETYLSTKVLAPQKKKIANLVTEAVLKTACYSSGKWTLDLARISIMKKIGESLTETSLLNGLALTNERSHDDMPSRITNAKIAVIKSELRINMDRTYTKGRTLYYDHTLVMENPRDMKAFHEENLRIFRDWADHLTGLGANVLVVEKGIDPRMEDRLVEHRIMAVRRIYIDDIERIALATGSRIVTAMENLTAQDLGSAKLVEERKLAGQRWVFFEGCQKHNALTILVRGPTEDVLHEAERVVTGALKICRIFLENQLITGGGGATEMEAASQLRSWSTTLSNREQFAVAAFARALEGVPAQLAVTAGLDPIDTISDLRTQHVNGETWAGIDHFQRKSVDTFKAKIWEAFAVKERVIKAATEIASTLIRVNDFIYYKRLPKPEFYEKQREEVTRPEVSKKQWREYGIAE